MSTKHYVCDVEQIEIGGRRAFTAGQTEIGVFRQGDEFYAYSNICLHQGGPACEGLIIAKVEERLGEDKTSKGLYFSDTELHFVCPWHGYEYDLRTGEFVGNRQRKLKKFDVTVEEGKLYVYA